MIWPCIICDGKRIRNGRGCAHCDGTGREPPRSLTATEKLKAAMEKPPVGYHKREIARGVFGEPSKIMEEATEFIDAIEQGSSVMALVELSDLVGAIKGYLAKHHPSIDLADLNDMSVITNRVFVNGIRSAR